MANNRRKFIVRCPFCGKYPKVDASSGMIPRFIIKCECGATIDSYSVQGRSGAIEAWNSRIYENKLPIMFVEDGSVDIDEVKKVTCKCSNLQARSSASANC